MKQIFTLLAFFLCSGINAQMHEGLFFKFGINTAYPKWEHVDLVVQEYSELRPWLTDKPTVGNKMGGVNIGYGVSWQYFWAEMDFMSNRNAMRYKGTDSSGVEHKGTFILINRGLTLTGGVKILPTEFVRIGIFAGLSFNPMVVKDAENKEYFQRITAFLVMPFQSLGNSAPAPIDTKMFLAGKIGCNLQIGGNYGVVFEPYWLLPFWKTDMASTRDALNPNTPSAYDRSLFKGSMYNWGLKFCAYIGFSG